MERRYPLVRYSRDPIGNTRMTVERDYGYDYRMARRLGYDVYGGGYYGNNSLVMGYNGGTRSGRRNGLNNYGGNGFGTS